MSGKRVRIHAAGGYDALRLEPFEIPTPLPNEALVQIHYAGVNYADVCVRWGLYKSAQQFEGGFPITPGFEFSGRIIAVNNSNNNTSNNAATIADASSDIAVDDFVFGVTRFNAYQSHVCVPLIQLFKLPSSVRVPRWRAEHYACLPAATLTAYYALHKLANVTRGQCILVHSAAGGVGSQLCQLALLMQCRVVGVVGQSCKVAYVKQLGVQHVIDKSTENLWEKAVEYQSSAIGDGYDAIFDANGVSTLRESYEHTVSGGRLIVYGFHSMLPRSTSSSTGSLWLYYPRLAWNWLKTPSFSPLQMTSDNKSVMAFNLSFFFHRKAEFRAYIAEVVELIERGELQPPKLWKTYDIANVQDAHRDIESGRTEGKLVLKLCAD